jgi:hypothetical protein
MCKAYNDAGLSYPPPPIFTPSPARQSTRVSLAAPHLACPCRCSTSPASKAQGARDSHRRTRLYSPSHGPGTAVGPRTSGFGGDLSRPCWLLFFWFGGWLAPAAPASPCVCVNEQHIDSCPKKEHESNGGGWRAQGREGKGEAKNMPMCPAPGNPMAWLKDTHVAQRPRTLAWATALSRRLQSLSGHNTHTHTTHTTHTTRTRHKLQDNYKERKNKA